MLTYFGLRQPIEGGAQDEVEITGSHPLFGSFFVLGDYLMGLGC
jgi:hypothetical protein